MKLTILLIALSLQVSATAFSQQVSLDYKNAPLQQVMQSILKQTGYGFIIDAINLKLAKPVTITLKGATIEETLQAIFLSQPFSYRIEGKSIIIQPRGEEKKREGESISPQKDIDGKVTDEKGNPLEGVTVILVPQNIGVATDRQGMFRFADAPDNGKLLIRMIGRETIEVTYKNGIVPNITLKEVNADLDEFQVIAYGKVQKKFATGNISSIKAEDIQKQPVSNLLLALQARVPSLYIQQTSGNTIGNVSVAVQGKNSIANGNNPFYVVDGVPYPNNNNSGLEGGIVGTGGGNSTLSFLNPADIESVEILKDADATAIYGSRAANGAILITTKGGKAGETKVDLNMQSGWGKVARTYDLLNTDQYVSLRKEAIKNGGNTISSTDYDVNGIWDQSRNTNWQKELAGGTAHFTNLNASISGGNENTQFRAGAGYIRQTTVYPENFADQKNNVHLSINHHSTDQRFAFNISGNYLQDENRISTGDLFQVALTLAPDAPAVFNSNGSVNWSPLPTDLSVYTFENPANIVLIKYNASTNNLIANSSIGYKILPGLELKTTLGYNRLEANVNSLIPITYYRPDSYYKARSASFGNNSIASWIAEPQLTYNRQYRFGNIETLLGGTFQQSRTDLLNQDASGFNNDAQLENIGAASTVTVRQTIQSLYRYSAIFGRINYRLKDRYILNLSVRRDGSSRFGSANLFNSFYSVAGAWIFTEEPMMRSLISIFNYGKIRASYGTSGNDQIGDYVFLSLYNNRGNQINYQNTIGLIPSGLNNPYLQWEETRKLNIGVDLGFLKNRILINANYFRNRSSNQLVNSPLPTTTGFLFIKQNLPATVQNTGLEITVDASALKNENFSWQISANFTLPKNKLIAFPEIENSVYANDLVVGQPVSIFKVYKFVGIDPETGFYQVLGSDGHLTSHPDYFKDRTQSVNTAPKWYGGISNSFHYKGIELSFLIQAVKSIKANYRFGPYFPGFFNINLPANFTNRWQKVGDVNGTQKVETSYDFLDPFFAALGSDASYSDATFLRLKNVSLSYTVPGKFLQKIHISNARVYVQGQNLFTVSKYMGDPETGYGNLPPLRMLSTGLQLTF